MDYPELLAIWREAERLGYDGASLYDVLSPPCLECWTTLTALTAATSRLEAVPLVLAQSYRHPGVLAKMAATLDVVSEGRLVLGLGAGGAEGDHRAYGIEWLPTPERVTRLEDGVRITRFLWSGRPGAITTPHFGTITGPGFPVPTSPGPPILIGGHGERYLLRAVARHAEICNVGFDLSVDRWEATKLLLDRYCIEEGRAPGSVELSHNATVGLGSRSQVRFGAARIGRPEDCLGCLEPYVAAGITWFFLLFTDLPDLSSLRLFAEAVFPAFDRSQTSAAAPQQPGTRAEQEGSSG